MAANIVLTIFILLPALFGVLAFRYFTAKPAQLAGRPRLDLIAGNSLVLLALLSLFLLAGEIYYRFVYDTTDAFGLARVTREWMVKHEHMNQFGFRDSVEYQMDRQAGMRRITFLGDSFTAGHGVRNVEDRFANRIRAAHPEWEVQVLATNGFDTGSELSLLLQLASARYPFDVVVLVYCLNDISDITPEWQSISQKIYAQDRPPFLVDHSYFLNTYFYRLKSARDPEISRYYHFVIGAYDGPQWETQQARLRAMADIVRQGGGRFLVVTFPFLHGMGADYEYTSIHDRLDGFFDDIRVPHLDLLSVYSTHPTRELIVNSRDPHPNEGAHQMAAEAIASFISAEIGP